MGEPARFRSLAQLYVYFVGLGGWRGSPAGSAVRKGSIWNISDESETTRTFKHRPSALHAGAYTMKHGKIQTGSSWKGYWPASRGQAVQSLAPTLRISVPGLDYEDVSSVASGAYKECVETQVARSFQDKMHRRIRIVPSTANLCRPRPRCAKRKLRQRSRNRSQGLFFQADTRVVTVSLPPKGTIQ